MKRVSGYESMNLVREDSLMDREPKREAIPLHSSVSAVVVGKPVYDLSNNKYTELKK